MDDLAALLAKFADAHGLSGYEDEVAALLREELEPLVDEVRIDAMGNVIGMRAGNGPTVMVAAHMDEIGLMVSHIDDEGFLRVVPVGGWFDQTILGQRVRHPHPPAARSPASWAPVRRTSWTPRTARR